MGDDLILEDDVGNPSAVTSSIWLRAYAGKDRELVSPGKWLLFLDRNDVDASWKAVKELLKDGYLGDSAKVSTAKESPLASEGKKHVICIYTRDSNDANDVAMVAYILLKRFDIDQIHYKEDIVTYLGLYEHNYYGVLCKYSASRNDVLDKNLDEYVAFFKEKGLNAGYNVDDMRSWVKKLKRRFFYSFEIPTLHLSREWMENVRNE